MPDTPHKAAYRQGWHDALTAVAIALHIATPAQALGRSGQQQRDYLGGER